MDGAKIYILAEPEKNLSSYLHLFDGFQYQLDNVIEYTIEVIDSNYQIDYERLEISRSIHASEQFRKLLLLYQANKIGPNDSIVVCNPYYFNIHGLRDIQMNLNLTNSVFGIWNNTYDTIRYANARATHQFQGYSKNYLLKSNLNGNPHFKFSKSRTSEIWLPELPRKKKPAKNRDDLILFLHDANDPKDKAHWIEVLSLSFPQWRFKIIDINKTDIGAFFRYCDRAKLLLSLSYNLNIPSSIYLEAMKRGCMPLMVTVPELSKWFPKFCLLETTTLQLLENRSKRMVDELRKQMRLQPIIESALKTAEDFIPENLKLAEELSKHLYDTEWFIRKVTAKI